jgi:hypothetical protein
MLARWRSVLPIFIDRAPSFRPFVTLRNLLKSGEETRLRRQSSKTGLRGMKPGEVRVVAGKKPHNEIIDPDLRSKLCTEEQSRRAGLKIRPFNLRLAHRQNGWLRLRP